MRSIDINELKKIELDILNRIRAFCDENHLRYFLYGGTLLGAIRHKGFIPWDDDIDILMPRLDYDYLIKNFLSDDEVVLLYPGTKGYYFNFTKAINPNTILYEANYKKIDGYGVYIDIFPLEGMPEDEEERIKHIKDMEVLRRQINAFAIDKPVLRKNIFAYLHQCFQFNRLKKSDVTVIQNKYMELVKKYNCNESNCLYVSGGAYHEKEMFEKDIFNDSFLVEFEGSLFNAPIQWDKCLRQLYGDYMTLPPENKRVPLHHFRAFYK